MNPTTIRNDANKIVRVTNISDFDFTSEMGAMFGGIPYFVPAGKSLLMPKPVGEHLAKHLARQIILRKAPTRDEKEVDGKGSDRNLWDDAVVNNMIARIITDVYEEELPAPRSESEIMRDKITQLNAVVASDESKNTDPSVPLTSNYVDKAEVILELQRRGITFDARQSKANLEKLLA